MSNSFLYRCFKLSISLNIWILSRCFVNGLQGLQVKPNCFRCNSGKTLFPFNKYFLMVLFIFELIIKIVEFFFFFKKINFFLPQIAQFDKNINLFCLVFLMLEFSFAAFFFTTEAIGFQVYSFWFYYILWFKLEF